MQKIKVVLWGLGSMGSGIGKFLTEREGIEIVAGIDNQAQKVGKDLGEVLNLDRKMGVKVTNRPEEVITEEIDIVLLATSSFLSEVFPSLELILAKGVNVITIAEEMAYPAATDQNFADRLDNLAKEKGVTILGTGINPGFVLDLLVITLTGACIDIKKIEAARVNDLSPFGPTVMRTQGVGTTVEEFEKGINDGTIVGHIGFKESINMITDRLGWKLDEIKEIREPIISNTYRETPYVKVAPGMVAGCRHIAYGIKDGEKVIVFEHPQQIHPAKEGIETGDYIKIKGNPEINMVIKPEIPGGIGTMAIAINMIPQVIAARPGLVSMKDLPVPSLFMGDVRKILEGYSSRISQ